MGRSDGGVLDLLDQSPTPQTLLRQTQRGIIVESVKANPTELGQDFRTGVGRTFDLDLTHRPSPFEIEGENQIDPPSDRIGGERHQPHTGEGIALFPQGLQALPETRGPLQRGNGAAAIEVGRAAEERGQTPVGAANLHRFDLGPRPGLEVQGWPLPPQTSPPPASVPQGPVELHHPVVASAGALSHHRSHPSCDLVGSHHRGLGHELLPTDFGGDENGAHRHGPGEDPCESAHQNLARVSSPRSWRRIRPASSRN